VPCRVFRLANVLGNLSGNGSVPVLNVELDMVECVYLLPLLNLTLQNLSMILHTLDILDVSALIRHLVCVDMRVDVAISED